MKKAAVALFMMVVCSVFLNVSYAQSELADRIELGREGGTTRAQSRAFSMQTLQAEPVVEAFISENTVSVSVQNYRGSALVEVVGSRGAKQAFIQVYDMGFDVISLAGMRAGEYTIRVTLGTEVFTGTFKKGMNGR